MKNSDPNRKILASIINCSLVTLISLPIYLMAGPDAWKPSAVALFFAYNLIFKKRCPGMIVTGMTYLERPASVRYVLLYSISYCSLLYSLEVPGDLLVINGLVFQLPSLALTGNTFHGWLGGQWTTCPSSPMATSAMNYAPATASRGGLCSMACGSSSA